MALQEAAHRPPPHRTHLEWTPERVLAWAEEAGPATAQLVLELLAGARHPQTRHRACLGITRLGRLYGAGRMEAAARRALRYDTPGYRSVKAILSNNPDKAPLEPAAEREAEPHENLRGRDCSEAPGGGKGERDADRTDS